MCYSSGPWAFGRCERTYAELLVARLRTTHTLEQLATIPVEAWLEALRQPMVPDHVDLINAALACRELVTEPAAAA